MRIEHTIPSDLLGQKSVRVLGGIDIYTSQRGAELVK
jgi:hypothetical protein